MVWWCGDGWLLAWLPGWCEEEYKDVSSDHFFTAETQASASQSCQAARMLQGHGYTTLQSFFQRTRSTFSSENKIVFQCRTDQV